jgi:acyl-coenzyme A synthetase/AMP-(fatty) acid ligase
MRALFQHSSAVQRRKSLGGIIGGASADAELCELLAGTQLRVGYGQTEAGPGIALGGPGEWREGFIGRATGCRTRRNSAGELEFKGPNRTAGQWGPQGLAISHSAWHATGDLVERRSDGWYFQGRRAHSVKLPNGRWLSPLAFERELARNSGSRGMILVATERDGRLRLFCEDERLAVHLNDADYARRLAPALKYLSRVEVLDPGGPPRTRKGEIDRAALMRASLAASVG